MKTVKRGCQMLLAWMLTSVGVWAENEISSEESEAIKDLVRDYLVAVRASDYQKASEYIHPAELKEFADGMKEGVALMSDPGDIAEMEAFFPGVDGPKYFEQHPPKEIFATFMNSLIAFNPELEGLLTTADARIVGALAESADRGCVVAKLKMTMEGQVIEVYEVLPIRRLEGEWMLAMKGQLKQLMKIMFAK